MIKIISNLIIIITVVIAITLNDNDEKSYGSHIARCEYDSLRLGSLLTDVFNAPVGTDYDWHDRSYQDEIIEHLGFAPWIANGLPNSGGLTLTKRSSHKLHKMKGWKGKDINDSPYAILNHKWIYMYGDSTTRQVWASFAAPFQGNHFERNAKEWSRHYCNPQEHRKHHVKGGHFPDEGWAGPCGANEKLCHVAGYGEGGLLSFDWKHFPYEDYDEWLWGPSGPWQTSKWMEGSRMPDVVTIQLGLHTCFHASPEGFYSPWLKEMNSTMVDNHLNDVDKLMENVRKAIDTPPKDYAGSLTSDGRRKVTVIVVTSGASGLGSNGTSIDDCILKFNRRTERAAHRQGFAVLERGEIERRLMYKSLRSDSPPIVEEMHLPQPAQNIIATCLLRLLTCLNESSITHEYKPIAKDHVMKQSRGHGQPLHSPPS